jgi:phage shock protein A
LANLEQSRQDIRRSLVEVNAGRVRLEKQQRQLKNWIDRYDEQAQAALLANDDDLAWEALQRKQTAVARQAELEQDLNSLERQLTSLKQSQANLDRKITLFRTKKDTLKALHTSSEAQLRVQEALAGVSEELTDVNSTVQRTERRIGEMQARAEAIEEQLDTVTHHSFPAIPRARCGGRSGQNNR